MELGKEMNMTMDFKTHAPGEECVVRAKKCTSNTCEHCSNHHIFA